MIKTDVLVVGAGVAGLSSAYFLGQSGQKSVVVIEQEKRLGGHSSGRNAGMLRQALSDPVLVELARESRAYFDRLNKLGWRNLDLKECGSLLLAQSKDIIKLKKIAQILKAKRIQGCWMTKAEIEKKVPLLEGGLFSKGFFCSSDATVELEPFLQGFLNALTALNVPVYRGLILRNIKSIEGGFWVEAGKKVFFTKKIVNAAGAWALWVGKKAGAANVPLKSYRRHLFTSRPSPLAAWSVSDWPFVWDISHDFYFRPLGSKLLMSPCDKIFEKRGDRSEKINPKTANVLRKKLDFFSKSMKSVDFDSPKSGLRTMVSDGRFVIGEDPRKKGFFWVAGLGGHGVTTCFSVGRMAADLVMGRPVDKKMETALSPCRFDRNLRRTKDEGRRTSGEGVLCCQR